MSFINQEDVGIQAVSHSRMKTHEGCPRKAKYKFIDKLKEPPNPAMERGLEIHKNLEHWVNAVFANEVHEEYDGSTVRGGIYDHIRTVCSEDFLGKPKYIVEAERQVAFNRNWEVVDWFAPDCWVRVVFDVVATSPCGSHMFLYDWKTGKIYDDHDDQADLYAVAAYKMGARAADVKFFYIDQDTVQPYEYSTDELESLVADVEARAELVTSDRLFPTNPGWRCKYCHFRRENGGPCAH